MLSTIRRHLRLSPASAIAVTALVFAMVGGAFAASNSSTVTTSKAKKGPTGPRGKKGPTGPQGAAGLQGATGPQGPPGSQGLPGSQGPTGPTGPIGPTGTFGSEPLPGGETLIGVWGALGEAGDDLLSPISFLIPVSPAPSAVVEFAPGVPFGLELTAGAAVIYGPNPSPATPQEEEEDVEAWETACPGSTANPEAAPGILCIYKSAQTGSSGTPATHAAMESANEFGVSVPSVLRGPAGSDQYVKGSWAVTAE